MTDMDNLLNDVSAACRDLHRLASEDLGNPQVEPATTIDTLPLLDAAMRFINTAYELTGSGHTVVQRYGARARAQGHSWDDIAAALRVDDGDDPHGARLRAFDLVAPDTTSAGDPLFVLWDCPACEQHITDRRPVDRRLADIAYEHGHTDTCLRRTSASWLRTPAT